jgi:hypothetical protein
MSDNIHDIEERVKIGNKHCELYKAGVEGSSPAFPTIKRDGITILDYFAAKAMQALITNVGPFEDDLEWCNGDSCGRSDVPNVEQVADYAYRLALRMCLARRSVEENCELMEGWE